MISFASDSAERRASTRKMPGSRGKREPSRWQRLNLWLRVQADALKLAPLGYLQAIAWRARGLKVRSRNRLSALTGHSRWAYPFWIACREPQIRSVVDCGLAGDVPRIVPVIDCSRGAGDIASSLASLPDGVEPIVVGGPPMPGVRGVARISAVAAEVDGSDIWLCPIRSGDRLAEGALDAYAAVAKASGPRVIYADDDLLDSDGCRVDPHFKPDWNPELFEHHDFVTGASVIKVRSDDLHRLPEQGWARALVAEHVGSHSEPLHIPFVLHHRLDRPRPVIPAKPPEIVSKRDWPLVTVIIPTRNRVDLLRKCIDGIRQTRYPAIEVIVVDNESDDRETVDFLLQIEASKAKVIRVPGEFNFSRLNNEAVSFAGGDLLCFLNNDIEMMDPDWLSLLVLQAVRTDIGAAGAMLLYPDGTIQHAGVFTGIGGGAGHGHRYLGKDEAGYFERSHIPQRVSAVTGACLVVSRAKFLAVGGFDEENFPVAFNDVDLCLKLNERGWQSFYEPRATLIHHESKSRGSDRLKGNRSRFARELQCLKRKWHTDERRDPFHHPQLSSFCEQFLIAI